MKSKTQRVSRALLHDLLNAVAYNGDPDTYFAIAFLLDSPCGDFINDFSETHLPSNKPGKKARELVKKHHREIARLLKESGKEIT